MSNNETNMAWVARDESIIAPCQHLSYFPMVIDHVDHDMIYDVEGNSYIDFLSSASSLNLGSCNPIITNAVKEQLDKYSQYTIVYAYGKPAIEYAERLASVYPGKIPVKVAFGNCGSDANDAAVKFCRAYTKRSKIITFINGYHGSTYGSMSMSMVTTKMRAKMGPTLPDIYCFPFYDETVEDARCERECVADLERAFDTYLDPEEVAAVIIEPIQGDAGLVVAHKIFMKKLYELCQKHGIMFVAEEVQQGFYRSGKFFSIEHFDIIPDGIILGKSAGAGFPLGAFIGRAEMMDVLPAPAHLFTLSGNAVSCVAGIAAFDYMQSEEFQSILKENTKIMNDCLADLCRKYPDVAFSTSGIDMSKALIIKKRNENGNMVPDPDGAYKILFRAYEKGLLVISLAGNRLRLQPPLNIKPENLKRGFEIIGEAIEDYKAGLITDECLKYRNGW